MSGLVNWRSTQKQAAQQKLNQLQQAQQVLLQEQRQHHLQLEIKQKIALENEQAALQQLAQQQVSELTVALEQLTDEPLITPLTIINNTMYTIYLSGSNTNGAISTQPLKPSPNQDSTAFLKLTCPADNNNYSITFSSTDIPNAFAVGSIAWSLGTTNIGFQRGQIYASQSNIYNNSITATLTVAGDNDPANPTGVYNAMDGAYHGFGPTWPAMTITSITVVYNQAVFPVPGPSPWPNPRPAYTKCIYYHQQWDTYGVWDESGPTPELLQPINTPSIKGRNYLMAYIPDDVTDVAYAFWWVDATGRVASGDDWADHELPNYPALPNMQPATRFAPGNAPAGTPNVVGYQYPISRGNVQGNFGALIALNAARLARGVPALNCALTIGGWTFSTYFSDAVRTATTRAQFVADCVTALKTWSDIFNGINFDWEYLTANGNNWGMPAGSPNDGNNYPVPPNNTYSANLTDDNDVANFCLFLDLLRQAILADPVLSKNNIKIGIPVTPAPEKAQYDINQLVAKSATTGLPLVDEIHIMTYDFHSGGWDAQTGFHSNPGAVLPAQLQNYPLPSYSTEEAVKYYLGLSGQISYGLDTPDKANIGFIANTNVPGTTLGTPLCPNQAQPNRVPLPNVPAGMLYIGAAFYSRGFANSGGPYTPGSGLPAVLPVWDAPGTNAQDGGVLPFNQIVNLSTTDPTWGAIQNDGDPTANPPTGTGAAYMHNATKQYCLTFDNPTSIGYKVNLVKKYGLGGMLAWDNASDIRVNPPADASQPYVSPVGSLTNAISTGLQLEKDPYVYYESKRSRVNLSHAGRRA